MITEPNKLGVAIITLSVAFVHGCNSETGTGVFRSVKVQPVTHYDTVLDKDATPQQVAFVLLRAIHDDVLATSKDNREAALDVQFDLAAAGVIRARNLTGLEPDEFVDRVVRHWSPTIAYYAHDLETEWTKAQGRLLRTSIREADLGSGPTEDCEVLIELADPSGDPNAQVLAFIWMAKDNDLWRVIQLGFKNNVRSVAGLRAKAVAARSQLDASGN